jgi:hypothetical protein
LRRAYATPPALVKKAVELVGAGAGPQ